MLALVKKKPPQTEERTHASRLPFVLKETWRQYGFIDFSFLLLFFFGKLWSPSRPFALFSTPQSSSAGQQLVPPPASAGPVGGGLIARASGKAPPGCGHFPVENPSSSQEKALGPACSTPASALTEPPSSFRWWPPPGNTLSTILMM